MTAAQVLGGAEGRAGEHREGLQREDGPALRHVTLYAGGEYDLYKLQEIHRRAPGRSLPSSRSPSSAATRTTSRTRVGTSTSRSSASTRTTRRSRPQHYLKWNSAGAEGERARPRLRQPGLDRAAEHAGPARVRRATCSYPTSLRVPRRAARSSCTSSPTRAAENARMANRQLFGVENSLKANRGQLAGSAGPESDRQEGRRGEGAARRRSPPIRSSPPARAPGTRSPRRRRPTPQRYKRDCTSWRRALGFRAGDDAPRARSSATSPRRRKPNEKRLRGVPRVQPEVAGVLALLRPRRSTRRLEKVTIADSLQGDGREARRRRSVRQEGPRRQVAGRAGRRARRGHEVEGRRLPQEARRGRQRRSRSPPIR